MKIIFLAIQLIATSFLQENERKMVTKRVDSAIFIDLTCALTL